MNFLQRNEITHRGLEFIRFGDLMKGDLLGTI